MKRIITASFIFACVLIYGQASTDNNTFGLTKYLGYNATNGINPLFTRTNNINRLRLNGNQTALINGVNQNVAGYFGIAPSGHFTSNSPWAMLHLEGPNSTPFVGNGWRSWMQTGLLMKEESDQMYVGLRRMGFNRSDAIVSWSDDVTGVDKLRFIFSGNASSGNGEGTNPLNGASFGGYEFMRMQNIPAIINEIGYPVGHVGIGPLFTDALTPQNRLHINAESALPTYTQITNVTGGGIVGTGQSANDGLKLGIQNTSGGQTGFLQWQEITPFIVQSDWNTVPGGITNGERMRISSASAPGVPASSFGLNSTRVSINAIGSIPINLPRATLHIGLNTGGGYAGWMEYGTLVATSGTTLFTGITDASYVEPDVAVVGFGSSNLLFLNAMQGEVGRVDEGTQNWGFGDYGPSGVINAAPTERIDVEGNGRLEKYPFKEENQLFWG